MANPPPPPFPTIAIVDPQYCAPYPVALTIKRERTFTEKYTVTDINGNVVFTAKTPSLTLREHRFLRDAYGNPILCLRRTLLGTDKWKAFRGSGSTSERDLIFTRERSSWFQLRTKLNVFLANNTSGVCDFKIKASFSERSWVVYIAESDMVAARDPQRNQILHNEWCNFQHLLK
ncbi:protein LURP-one-related 15-like isoform X2 [Arachis stenosperma]|uniref:protein LURP-one-related 15-like isoform X2 n=1 Tax=Arachis stenosperma TaxID=217475 RepID=UPI0025AC85E1|nr:protein LURP-one-related 15-like isoform X2 [Arachis stenosperma]